MVADAPGIVRAATGVERPPDEEVSPELLELGEETIRSHIKKAQMKLGVKDRLHAVAEALRHQLIP